MNISTIIPTYKSTEALDLCLESAIKGAKNRQQIIVVVDGHYDINKEVLDKWRDDIDILNMNTNVGLCKATNLGVYNAENDFVLIVNDDNVFPMHWDEKLLKHAIDGSVITPNQIEPYQSMFKQFHIHDLGRRIKDFNLEEFWEYEKNLSYNKRDLTGSTLPIFMNKFDYLKVGGWDENYDLGMVADWDFFLKCQEVGYNMYRVYDCHFYHFVSLSTKTQETITKRQIAETKGHAYAKYKWGTNIKHNPNNNEKYL